MPNCNSRSIRIPTSVTLDSSQTYISANEKQVRLDHSVTIILDHWDKLLKMTEIRAQQVLATIWLNKTFHPKHSKLSRIKVFISLIQNGPQAKECAITDKMLNSARVDLTSIDQTTALICASVITRASYVMAWMKSQLACVVRITDVGTRITNCDVINIWNIITS